MSTAALKYISELMKTIGIPYDFMRWNERISGLPPDCHFIGDYIEEPSLTKEENGYQASTFILRGYSRGDYEALEEAKAKIEKNVAKTAILPDGTGIAVFYEDGSYVPTGDAEMKSIKINLSIQEWRVK